MKWLLSIFLIFSFSNSAAADLLTPDDLEFFRDNSRSRHVIKSVKASPDDLEHLLYSLVGENQSSEKTISDFAEILHIPTKQANLFAQVIIDAVRARKACGNPREKSRCDISKDAAFLARLKEAGALDEEGGLLFAVGKNLTQNHNRATLISTVAGLPFIEASMIGLYDYTRDIRYLAPLLEANGPRLKYLAAILLSPRSPGLGVIDRLALGEEAAKRSVNNPELRSEYLAFESLFLSNLLESGLSGAAADAYLALPKGIKIDLWQFLSSRENLFVDLGTKYGRFPKRLSVDLAAAMLEREETEELLKLLWVARNKMNAQLSFRDAQRLQFLEEMAEPMLEADEQYGLFIDGHRPDEAKLELTREERRDIDGFLGWLWALKKGAPVFRYLGQKYLSGANYPTMARFLTSGRLFYEPRPSPEITSVLSAALGNSFDQGRKHFASEIEMAKSRMEALTEASAQSGTTKPLYRGERPVYFTENPLPAEYQQDRNAQAEEERKLPEDLKLPVSEYQVVRLEKHEGEWFLVYLSHSLDPVGEVSGGGYWLTRTTNQGSKWEKPTYLGLQQFYPYVVLPQSKLPLADGDTIRLEVAVNEIDERSITFPPVGLRTKRRKEGIFLEFSWDGVQKDTDDDGLTDIVEHRLGLDPHNPDSDGDVRRDGADSLPLVPYDFDKAANSGVALAMIEQIFGYEKGAIVQGIAPESEDLNEFISRTMGSGRPNIDAEHTLFLSGDSGLFAGLDIPIRLIIYNPKEMEALGKQYGVFYPVSVPWIFRNGDGTQVYVIWTASWTGGEFKITRTEDGYETNVTSRWIT